jgi:hypothetical protein
MLALFVLNSAHFAMGSFTGTTNDKVRNIYSLKNFNSNFYKSASPFSLRAGFHYTGSPLTSYKKENSGDLTLISMMRFEKGNTTYIYPYKHRVSVPKFKTPAPPSFR